MFLRETRQVFLNRAKVHVRFGNSKRPPSQLRIGATARISAGNILTYAAGVLSSLHQKKLYTRTGGGGSTSVRDFFCVIASFKAEQFTTESRRTRKRKYILNLHFSVLSVTPGQRVVNRIGGN